MLIWACHPLCRPILRPGFRPAFQPPFRPIVRPTFRPIFRPGFRRAANMANFSTRYSSRSPKKRSTEAPTLVKPSKAHSPRAQPTQSSYRRRHGFCSSQEGGAMKCARWSNPALPTAQERNLHRLPIEDGVVFAARRRAAQ